MINIKNNTKVAFYILFVLVLAFISFNLFYGEKDVEDRRYEDEDYSPEVLNEIFDRGAEALKNSFLESNNYLIGNLVLCDAVLNGVNECDILKNDNSRSLCTSHAISLRELKNAAENNCDNLPENSSISKDFCEALHKDCRGMFGDKRSLCESVLGKDIRKCSSLDVPGQDLDGEVCGESIKMYWAFVSRDTLVCNDIYESVSQQEACKGMILGGCSNVIDSVMKDLTVLGYAKDQESLGVCQAISNERIRTMCFNKDATYEEISYII